MVITLTDTGSKGVKMYFPVLPEKISYQNEAYFQEYEIINKGRAKIPGGQEIATIGWESFFPGENLTDQPYVGNWSTPNSLHKQLEKWQSNGTKLKLNITGTPFSLWVYIDKYDVTVQDANGSLFYTIEFSKVITVTVGVEAKINKATNKTTGTNRVSKKSTEKKYTIKKGDCLWNIAKKYYKKGSEWKKIYNANKSIIENAAKKHGKKSSNNGNLIFPGTVIKIP